MEVVEMIDILPTGPSESSTNVFTGETPYKGMEFLTDEEAYNHYNLYARTVGIGIHKDAGEKSRKSSVGFIARTFVRNKAGRKRLSDKREFGKLINRRPDTRVDCGAKMTIRLTSLNTWMVSKFVEDHNNHELTSLDKVMNHYSHKQRHRTDTCRSWIGQLSEEGVPPRTIAQVLNVAYGSQDGEHITPQQCNDHIRTLRKKNIGNECFSIIRNFQDRRQMDPDFYFAMEVDHLGTIRSVFWADGKSRSSYLSLGDVVVFDVTYKTNHLSLSFAPFTGVNHHWQSTLFGCALLTDEQVDTFVWLFARWLKCTYRIAPKAIIKDQDAQIGGAIKKVFPNTLHRFCFAYREAYCRASTAIEEPIWR